MNIRSRDLPYFRERVEMFAVLLISLEANEMLRHSIERSDFTKNPGESCYCGSC